MDAGITALNTVAQTVNSGDSTAYTTGRARITATSTTFTQGLVGYPNADPQLTAKIRGLADQHTAAAALLDPAKTSEYIAALTTLNGTQVQLVGVCGAGASAPPSTPPPSSPAVVPPPIGEAPIGE